MSYAGKNDQSRAEVYRMQDAHFSSRCKFIKSTYGSTFARVRNKIVNRNVDFLSFF